MKYKYILFDLDGTLTDPGLGITNSVMHALEKFDIRVEDRTELYKFIGPPLLASFERYYKLSKEDCERALHYYREYFSVKGLYENEVYEGIAELLRTLKQEGRKVILATSKPDKFSIRILEHFRLLEYFDFIAASTMDEKRTDKAEVIAYAIENMGIDDKSKVIMIGDREHDIFGAVKNGIESIGVTYGYGGFEELKNAGATYTVDSVEELSELLKRN